MGKSKIAELRTAQTAHTENRRNVRTFADGFSRPWTNVLPVQRNSGRSEAQLFRSSAGCVQLPQHPVWYVTRFSCGALHFNFQCALIYFHWNVALFLLTASISIAGACYQLVPRRPATAPRTTRELESWLRQSQIICWLALADLLASMGKNLVPRALRNRTRSKIVSVSL